MKAQPKAAAKPAKALVKAAVKAPPKAAAPTKAAGKKPASPPGKAPKPAKAQAPAKAPKAPKAAKAAPAEKPGKTMRPPRAKDSPPTRMRDPIAPIDTIRTPDKADDLKARLGRISSVIAQLRGLKRTFERSFYEAGEILAEVSEARLFEVKGYGSLEAFLDRETEIGSSAGARALRATTVFRRPAAEAAGFSRISAALRALDGEPDAPSVGDRHTSSSLPPHKL